MIRTYVQAVKKALFVGAAVSLLGGALALVPAVVPAAATPSLAWTQVNGAQNGCTNSCSTYPDGRAAPALGYDGASNQVVLFGGLGASGGSASFNDTWTWDGTAWTQVGDSTDPDCTNTCASSPPVRAAASLAYDAASNQLILFGGQGSGPFLNDTWTWNGTTWTQVDDGTDAGCTNTCTDSPPARSGYAMTYDPAIEKIVLFGGLGPQNDTWTWNGTTWAQVADGTDAGCTNSCTDSPPDSVAPSLAYDQSSNQLILFGGASYNGNDTWEFNGTAWAQVDDTGDAGCTDTCTSSPPARSGAGMDYDAAIGKLVLFGGLAETMSFDNVNDTWTWNGTTWTQVADGTDAACTDACTSSPPARSAVQAAYDTKTGDLVVFGGQGNGYLDDTWNWNGTAWAQANGAANGCTTACASYPSARAALALAYDGATQQVVLFGGLFGGYTNFNDTWTWDASGWSQVDDATDPGCSGSCTSSPPERAATVMAYDAASRQLILFGGQGADSYLNDTWAWNGTTWTQVDDSTDVGCTDTCTDSPPARSGSSMAYDPALGELVLFGGLGPANDDTWAWNGTTWTQLDDSTAIGCTTACPDSPPGSETPTMAYDQSSDQLILFGADGYSGNDTWEFNGSTWTQVDDTGDAGCTSACTDSPPARSGGGLDYDAALGELVLFGGLGEGNLNDTWTWNGTTWTQVDDGTDAGCTDTCTDSPLARSALSAAYDQATGDFVVFGGQGDNVLDDTWVIGLVPTTTTVSVSPSSANEGQSVTYSASVSSLAGTATGSVSFTSGSTVLCTATLSNGSGSCSASNAPVGTDTITGSYSGDAGHSTSLGSTSLVVATAGYTTVASDGGIFAFGTATFHGSMGGMHLNAPIVGMAETSTGNGYWLVASDGGIFAFGTATFHGSMGGMHLNAPIVGMAADPATGGYWLVAADGGIFAFTAPSKGSMGGMHLNAPIVGMAATSTGNGYWLVASDGGIFAFGTATFHGSMGGMHLNAPIVGIAADATTGGYWLVASDGGIFAFGTATFHGSMGGMHLNAPIVGIAGDAATGGYWEVASDGGIFAFTAPYEGSMGGLPLVAPMVGIAGV